MRNGLFAQIPEQDCALEPVFPRLPQGQDDSDQGIKALFGSLSNESRTPSFYSQIICPSILKQPKEEKGKAPFHLHQTHLLE